MKHTLSPLPYYHGSLEPHIDALTMAVHHDKHHASYVDNLNAALEPYPELRERTAIWLMLNAEKIPKEARTAILNNAGGHVNHSLLWRAMAPGRGGEPAGALADAIRRDFGGFDAFKARFDEAGARQFGSGWVWLARAQRGAGKLEVCTTAGHDNPVTQGRFPILVNDVWEHAYYLKHQNRRGDYLKGWWPVVDWEEAARRYALSGHAAELEPEDEGGLLLTTAA